MNPYTAYVHLYLSYLKFKWVYFLSKESRQVVSGIETQVSASMVADLHWLGFDLDLIMTEGRELYTEYWLRVISLHENIRWNWMNKSFLTSPRYGTITLVTLCPRYLDLLLEILNEQPAIHYYWSRSTFIASFRQRHQWNDGVWALGKGLSKEASMCLRAPVEASHCITTQCFGRSCNRWVSTWKSTSYVTLEIVLSAL